MGRLEYTKPNNSVTLEWNWKKCFKWDCVISFVPYNRRSNDYQLMGSAEYRSQDAPPPRPTFVPHFTAYIPLSWQ